MGSESRFFHVSGWLCHADFHYLDFQRTLPALSEERSRLESGFQEKKLTTGGGRDEGLGMKDEGEIDGEDCW